MQPLTVLLGTDQVLTLKHLKNVLTDGWVNDATVLAYLKDENGNNVEGQTWPTQMQPVSDIKGGFQCRIRSNVNVQKGERYTVKILVSTVGGVKARIVRDVIAKDYEM